MKGNAYSFAQQVDREIEAQHSSTISAGEAVVNAFERNSSKSADSLYLKQPGLEIEIEAFEDDGPVDGHIRESRSGVSGSSERYGGTQANIAMRLIERVRVR